MNDKNVTCTITKPVAVLSENGKGYTLEVNFVSWNEADAKLDIRNWAPGHERSLKGITLDETQGRNLYEALKKLYVTELAEDDSFALC